MAERRKGSTGRTPRRARVSAAAADAWRIELHTERTGLHPDRAGQFAYRYERLRVERVGRRCTARELRLQLDYDNDLRLVTKPARMIRQRGRSLTLDEAGALWDRVHELSRRRLRESYPCLDDTDPAELDDALGPDGVPLAVSLGEEGPACLTIRVGRAADRLHRVTIDRYRAPAVEAAQRGRARRAPLTALVALLDPGLGAAAPFNYRRSNAPDDLLAEYLELKGMAFLNLRQFERRCLQALGAQGDARALPHLTGALFVSDPEVRLQALDALASLGSEAAAAEIELLRYDDNPSVRERARSVLDRLRGEVPF